MELFIGLWDLAVVTGKCVLIGVPLVPGVFITFSHMSVLWYQYRNGLLRAKVGEGNNPYTQMLAGAEMILWVFGYVCLLISLLLYLLLF